MADNPYGGTIPTIPEQQHTTTSVPVAPSAPKDTLAYTGADVVGIVFLAILLIVIGTLLWRWAGRNRPNLEVKW